MIKLLSPGDKCYEQFLSEAQVDFYNLPFYIEYDAKMLVGEPVIFFYETDTHKIAIPFIRRKLPEHIDRKQKYSDLVSPYGYPGISVSGKISFADWIKFFRYLLAYCREEKIISAFIRLHPLYNNILFPQDEHIQQLINGKTVSVALNKDIEEIKSTYSTNHKRNIKKLVKEGYQVKTNQWEHLKEWIAVYNESMQRFSASTYYFFPEEYYLELSRNLKDNCLFISVHNDQGILVAGGIFVICGSIMQYHLGGTGAAYLSDSPSKLMFDHVIEIARNKELELLHLGGGFRSNEDSLYHFKKGFGDQISFFSVLRMIPDPAVYKDLCALNNKDELQNPDFFPFYRAV